MPCEAMAHTSSVPLVIKLEVPPLVLTLLEYWNIVGFKGVVHVACNTVLMRAGAELELGGDEISQLISLEGGRGYN